MFADVIIYLKVPLGILTYQVPANIANEIKIGQIVRVDFRGKKAFGLIINFHKHSQLLKLKKIIEIVDYNVLPLKYIELIRWVSQYYGSSLSESLTVMLPAPPVKIKKVPSGKSNNLNKTKNAFFIAGNKRTRWQIYAQIIKKTRSEGGQSILCFPQIEDSYKFKKLLEKNINLAIYHSKLSKTEKYELYSASKTEKFDLFCGVRNVATLPLPNLKTIIIDEEQAVSHHSDQKPYLSTSKVANWIAEKRGLNIFWGNPAPTLKLWHEINKKAVKLLTKDYFLAEYRKNQIQFVQNDREIVSLILKEAVLDTLKKGEKVFIFNGSSDNLLVKCFDCKELIRCKKCERVLNLKGKILHCPKCNFESALPNLCPGCSGVNLKQIGYSREDLYKFFQIKYEEKNILFGTQVELEKLQSEKFALAIGLNMDYLLDIMSFDQDEKILFILFKLLALSQKKLIIQSNRIEEPIFEKFKNLKIEKFYEEMCQSREKLKLPPFGKIALITAKAKTLKESFKKLDAFIDQINNLDGIEIIGPYEKSNFRKENLAYAQIFVKYKSEKQKSNIIKSLAEDLYFEIEG